MDSYAYSLHEWAENGDFEALNTLLSVATEPEKKKLLHQLDNKMMQGHTPLHYAIENAHLEVTQLLLQHGADPNFKDKWGKSPLHWALKNWGSVGHESAEQLVRLLLTYGADFACSTFSKNTPLHDAVYDKNFRAIYCLLNHPKVTSTLRDQQVATVNANGETALYHLLLGLIELRKAQFLSLQTLENSKRCLYAFLLSGVNVEAALQKLPIRHDDYLIIDAIITEAVGLIAATKTKARKECGHYGEEILQWYLLNEQNDPYAAYSRAHFKVTMGRPVL